MFNRESLEKMIIALMVMAVSFLFVQSVKVDPVVTAVDKLTVVMVENQKSNHKRFKEMQSDNADEHSELAQMIYGQNNIIADGRARLINVEARCDENHQDIKDCKETH